MARTSFPRFGLLFSLNLLILGCFGTFVFFPILRESRGGEYLYSFITLCAAFFLVGQNITASLEAGIRERFSLLEKFFIITLVALFASPIAVTLASEIVTDTLRFVPILLAGITGSIAVWTRPFFWEETPKTQYSPHLVPAGLLAVTLYAFFFFRFVGSYYALPDLDPYYWLQKFQSEYLANQVTNIRLHRPLFSSLGYIFSQTADIDLYAYFKYLLPAFALIIIVPATLVANWMRHFSHALLVFLLPAVSGSFLLYSFSSIPQAILNLSFLSSLYCIVYALVAHRAVLYFFSGGILFLSIPYHEMATLFFLPWFGITLALYRKELRTLIRGNPWAWTLGFILIISHLFPILLTLGKFSILWTERIVREIVSLEPNFAFPATYVNIDGNTVGWSDWYGVLRYYAFYLGPLTIGSILVLLWQHYHQKLPAQLIVMKSVSFERATRGFLWTIFVLFFLIAEILPRFFNIALLPERALGFFGTVPLAFLMIALANHTKRHWTGAVAALLIGAALINAGAGLYINSQKRFIITSAQISSAKWIRESLPAHRVILTGNSWNLIRFYSQTGSAIYVDDPSFYHDIRVFQATVQELPNEDSLYPSSLARLVHRIKIVIEQVQSLDPAIKKGQIADKLFSVESDIQAFRTSEFLNVSSKTPLNQPRIYIYYAKPDARNPYINRPYMKNHKVTPPSENLFVFDQYPDRFHRIYTLPRDEVIIWELIQ